MAYLHQSEYMVIDLMLLFNIIIGILQVRPEGQFRQVSRKAQVMGGERQGFLC